MFCSQCGAGLSEASSYCGKCGEKAASTVPVPQQRDPRKSRINRKAIIIWSGASVLGATVSGMILTALSLNILAWSSAISICIVLCCAGGAGAQACWREGMFVGMFFGIWNFLMTILIADKIARLTGAEDGALILQTLLYIPFHAALGAFGGYCGSSLFGKGDAESNS